MGINKKRFYSSESSATLVAVLAITHSECQMCFSGFWSHAIQRMPAKQYTHFSSCNPHGVRKGLIKGEALRLLRTNSSAKSFYENIYNFKKRLRARGYPHNLIDKITSEVKFTERKSALPKNNEVRKEILPFVAYTTLLCSLSIRPS